MLTLDIIITNSKNQSVINYLSKEQHPANLKYLSDEAQLEKQKSKIKTHPDIVELLWEATKKNISEKCQAILFGKPVLINPDSGVVFGLAEGSNPLLLRLSETDRYTLLEEGGRIILSNQDGIYANATEAGSDWIYCFSFIEGLDKYFIKAYNYSQDDGK